MLGISHYVRSGAMAAALALTVAGPGVVRADVVLSDNLPADNPTNSVGGTETATGSTLLAVSFSTGASSSTLDTVTLLLANASADASVTVSLYSDAGAVSIPGVTNYGGLSPDADLGDLTMAGGLPTGSTPTAATFAGSGLALAAGTTYWIVLQATTGSVDWAWSGGDAGLGAGFTDTWAESVPGLGWFTYAGSDPSGFNVGSDPLFLSLAASPAAVPEPASMALLGAGGLGLLSRRCLRRRAGARTGRNP